MLIRCAICTLCFLTLLAQLYAATPESIVIHMSDDAVLVRTFTEGHVDLGDGNQGLVVWADGDHDRWQFFSGSWTRSSISSDDGSATDFLALTRGLSSRSSSGLEVPQPTTLLAKLSVPSVTRGSGLIVTPYEGSLLLNPRVTFRRSGGNRGEKLSAVEATLRQAGKDLLKIQFPEEATTVTWADMAGLSDGFRRGLPAGRYEFELPTPEGILEFERVSFTVAEPTVRGRVLADSDALTALLPQHSPLGAQLAVESLLAHRPALLVDAMDRIEEFPDEELTKRLKLLEQHVVTGLQDPGQQPDLAEPADDPTGDTAIDLVRNLIVASRWKEALEELDSLEAERNSDDARRQALAQMYRGVILGESGPGKENETFSAFQRAIALFDGVADNEQDRYRVNNNFANFLLSRATDRLHNHAFQMAAGVHLPLVNSLDNWIEARRHFELALSLTKSTDQKAAVQLNLARQFAFLADVIETLSDHDSAQRLPAAEKGARSYAARQLQEVIELVGSGNGDSFIVAVAEEQLAQLAYRAGEFVESEKQARRALDLYLDAGALTGVESVCRLIGLCLRSRELNKDALQYFLASEQLSEILRARYPADQFGLSRAGFFSRRAYVTEHIVELLIAQGRDAEALFHAERRKARAFQDTLAARSILQEQLKPITSAELLSAWPEDIAALEYFLGSEKGWVFLTDSTGTKAYPLADGEQPVASRQLVFRLREFLSRDNPVGMNGYKKKLYTKLKRKQGFDKEWQDELAWFRQILLPNPAFKRLRTAKMVVVVPCHVLHYFPFAALVTERDDRHLGKQELPVPKFLIDEPLDIIYSPSVAIWRQFQKQDASAIAIASAVGIVDCPGEDRLPGVSKDLEGMRRSFAESLETVLAEGAATKTAVTTLLKNPGLVLLAMHGNNQPDTPLKSHLVLYPSDNGEWPSRLTAEDIYRETVRSQLVVLSACYSGLSDRSPMAGDELFGLQRAFLSSGTKTVLSGLWDVCDEAGPELIAGFHERIAKGESAVHALAESQRAFLRKYRSARGVEPYLHPHFWAVYTVAGDHRTTMSNSTKR